MKAFEYIDPIESKKVSTRHLLLGLLSHAGAVVSGVDGVDTEEENWSNDWEWFDPSLITNEEEVEELPDHWYHILKNQNRTCWSLKYRYVHSPEEIICRYPHVPIKGIFVVVNDKATKETVTADDLIHLGGEFTLYNNRDKDIWKDWIEMNQEQ